MPRTIGSGNDSQSVVLIDRECIEHFNYCSAAIAVIVNGAIRLSANPLENAVINASEPQ